MQASKVLILFQPFFGLSLVLFDLREKPSSEFTELVVQSVLIWYDDRCYHFRGLLNRQLSGTDIKVSLFDAGARGLRVSSRDDIG